MTIVRSLDRSCNPQKITVDDHKNDKPEGKKNEKSILAIRDSIVKHLNAWEMSKNRTQIVKYLLKPFQVQKQHA